MHFFYVDRIIDFTETSITGQVVFRPQEPMRYSLGDRAGEFVAAGAVSEAIGQLVSWLVLKNGGFSTRAVFLFAEKIQIRKIVPVGTALDLFGAIESLDDGHLIFSGCAKKDGITIQEIQKCHCKLIPIEQLEFADVTRDRFSMLARDFGPGREMPAPFAADRLIRADDINDRGEQGVFRLETTSDLWFYRDHFPRFPVTPIVVINEAIGAAVGRMLRRRTPSVAIPRGVSDIKIKSFIAPQESSELSISAEYAVGENPSGMRATATIKKSGRPVLRGVYDFDLVLAQ